MDVDSSNFRKHLLPLLSNIANASFITFDLEMSGITTRPKFSSQDRSHDIGKPTLQEQYEEMKSAAETFQVLQVGITIVEEEKDKEFYLARPYNFNLSPIVSGTMDMRTERTFSFSSSACDFLLSTGLDFGKVFHSGVPYLSRAEEDEVREEYDQRADRNAKIPNVVVQPQDHATIDFQRAVRSTISSWLKNPKSGPKYVNIGNPSGPLNGFQRRLVYQIVRNEFPALRTFARNDNSFMQVEKLDVDKENEFQKKKLNFFNAHVINQKGLTWVFEALAGGNLAELKASYFSQDNAGKDGESNAKVTAELERIRGALLSKRNVIVGHNLFMDLGFLYKTFVGPLPQIFEHFQEDIHELFPIIIDTKYLATHDTDEMNPRARLRDLVIPFRKVDTPLILLDDDHLAYDGVTKAHEAGYDSWMTAELFVKLTYKLYKEKKYLNYLSDRPQKPLEASDSEKSICPRCLGVCKPRCDGLATLPSEEDQDEGGGVKLTSHGTASKARPATKTPSPTLTSTSTPPSSMASKLPTPSSSSSASASASTSTSKKNHLRSKSNNPRSRNNNPFALLDLDLIDLHDSHENELLDKPSPKKPKVVKQRIPNMDDRFWEVYANRLRVAAAQGGVCDLAQRQRD